MTPTETRPLEGTPEQLTALLKQLPHRKRYRLVEVAESEPAPHEEVSESPLQDAATLALLRSWIAEAPTDPEEIRKAEAELLEFKRNMNLPRKTGEMRLLYPEAETE